MKTYPEMKDSGVEWIGEIPSHWGLRRFSSLGLFSKGKGITKGEVQDSGLPCIRYGEIYTRYDFSFEEVNSWISPEGSEGLTTCDKGTLLMTSSGETREDIGKCVVYTGEVPLWVGGDIVIMTPFPRVNPLFLSRVLNSHVGVVQRTQFGRGEIIVHISSKDLRQILTPFPPLHEQQEIVSFLDEKTGLIDDLITKKTRRIELLKEMRSSLISEVVTKGLDPDVEMKDSGVEWIGEIPSHWEVTPLRRVSSHETEKGTPTEGDITISPENVESGTGRVLNNHSPHSGDGWRFEPGDILFNKLRTYLRKVVHSEYTGYSMGEMIVIRPLRVNSRLLFYVMSDVSHVYNLNSFSTGVKLPRTDPYWITHSDIPLPPPHEQQDIVSFLDEKTGLIHEEVSREEESIIKLKELRESLISEVVTGKRDVRKVS